MRTNGISSIVPSYVPAVRSSSTLIRWSSLFDRRCCAGVRSQLAGCPLSNGSRILSSTHSPSPAAS
eukprot:16297-Eustigmatos_ZCMA.PRE.1